MEYRIEQLAQVAGVAVDTIRFYQGQGLLEPPRREGRVTWYNQSHLERLRRIRDLQQRGFKLVVIRRFLDGELEALVEAVTAPPAPDTLSLEELALRSGLAPSIIRGLEQAGLLAAIDTDGAEARYRSSDLQVLAAGLKLVEAGVPIGALVELGTRYAGAVDDVAHEAVGLFDRHVRERLQSDGEATSEAGSELLRIFEELLDATGDLVRHHFRRTLLQAAREHIEQTA